MSDSVDWGPILKALAHHVSGLRPDVWMRVERRSNNRSWIVELRRGDRGGGIELWDRDQDLWDMRLRGWVEYQARSISDKESIAECPRCDDAGYRSEGLNLPFFCSHEVEGEG